MNRTDPCRRFEDLQDKLLQAETSLTAEERQFIDEHEAACADCRAEAALLGQLASMGERAPEQEPSESVLEMKARRLLFLEEERARPRVRPTARMWWFGAGALATAAMVALVLFALPGLWSPLLGTGADDGLWQGTEVHLAEMSGDVTISGGEAREGEPITTGAALDVRDGWALLACGEGTTVRVESGSKLSLVKARKRKVRFRLDKGRATFEVTPRARGSKFHVDTPHGRIRVIGTRFTVTADPSDTEVRVLRGTVHFAVRGSRNVEIRAGEVYSVALGLRSFDDEHRVARSDSEARDEQAQPSPPEAPPPKSKSKSKAPPRTVASMLDEVRTHRAEGDWDAVIATYRKLQKHHPDAPEAHTCKVLMAHVYLRKKKDPEKALELYRSYLAQTPDGSLAEEASWGEIKCLGKLGRESREKKAIESFVDAYPQSPHAGEAASRLDEIDAGEGV